MNTALHINPTKRAVGVSLSCDAIFQLLQSDLVFPLLLGSGCGKKNTAAGARSGFPPVPRVLI